MKSQGLIIFLAFLSLSVLGFSSMAHEGHATHHSCLFDFSSNCARVVDPINSIFEHLANLQNSIQAAPGQSFVLTLLLAFSLIVAAWVLDKEKLRIAQYFHTLKSQLFDRLFEFKNRFLAWLSILNRRDPLVIQTAR